MPSGGDWRIPGFQSQPPNTGVWPRGHQRKCKEDQICTLDPSNFQINVGKRGKERICPTRLLYSKMKEKSRWFAKDPKEAKLRFSSIPFPSQPSLGPLGDRKAEK